MQPQSSKPNLEDLILTFRRKVMDVCRKEGLTSDLTFSQIEIVKFIGLDRSVPMRAIADHLKITPPSVTSIVDELEKKGVVTRQPDPQDRRIVSVSLTKKAKALYGAMAKHKENILHDMLSRLNAKDRVSLERIIKILISN